MQTFLIRKIDVWVGVPLCALLTPVHHVLRVLGALAARPRPVRKILVIKMAELGAIILAYPLFKAVKETYPQAEIHVLTFEKNREIFGLLDGVIDARRVITIDDRSWVSMMLGLARQFFTLWRQGFDIVIDLEFFSRIGAVLTFASRAPVAAGFYRYGFEGLSRGNFLTHKVAYNPLVHVTVNFMAVVEALKAPEKRSPELRRSIDGTDIQFPVYGSRPEARQAMERFGLDGSKEIFLMNAGEGTIPLREWPLENFEAVARFILSDPGRVLVLVGGDSADGKARRLMARLEDPRVVNCSGKTSLPELMELFLISRAVVANDCGIMHLAMLTPIEKIVLFGPESPQMFRPLGERTHILYSNWPCSPCLSVLNHRVSFCRDNICLKVIEPRQVIEIIKQLRTPLRTTHLDLNSRR